MKVVYIDGFKIRNTLDDDFGIIHQHSAGIGYYSPKFYIPQGEWWIDRRYKKETEFLIQVEEYGATHPYKKINPHDTADKARASLAALCAPPPVPRFEIKKKKSGRLIIVQVDGSIVRRYLDPEFILGGHDLVYSYVPANTIWLDAHMDPREMPYILLHEETERRLMSQKESYDFAHEIATVTDKEARRRGCKAKYPGDADYPWRGLSNQEILKKYVSR